MKLCTGPRYGGEFLSLSSMPDWHGCFGHSNVATLDQHSAITGKGRHDRVHVSLPRHWEEVDVVAFQATVDNIWNLGTPTEKQIREVALKDQGIRGRWRLVLVDTWDDGRRTDFYFVQPDSISTKSKP